MRTHFQPNSWQAALLSAGLVAVSFVLREHWGRVFGLASVAE
jgi:hypothetical protein